MRIENRTWRDAYSLFKADLRRRLELEGKAVSRLNALGLLVMPGVVCIAAYRVTTVLQSKGYRILDRIVQDLQHLYTGIELHPGSDIGPGFVVGDRPGGGISEHVKLGRNCTLLGTCTMTLNTDRIDLSKGWIVLGDHCVVGTGVRIMGSVTLGACTQIKPNAVVLTSSPTPGGVLDGIPARRVATVPVEAVMRWNPLRPGRPVGNDRGGVNEGVGTQ